MKKELPIDQQSSFHPLVTIGIANYNYAEFVTQALNSVAGQTYPNCEIIIVDDDSNDNSIEVINKWIKEYRGGFKIIFIKNDVNLGVVNVCNLILEKARGKYYQILDADDVILPKKIETEVEMLERRENLVLVYSNISVIDSKNRIVNDNYFDRIGYDHNNMPQGDVFQELLLFNFIPNPSVLIRTQSAKQIGGYNSSFQVQDYYLYLKLSQSFPFYYLNNITASYRFHGDSLSNSLRTNSKSIDSSLKLQYLHYHKGNKQAKARIRKSIYNMAPYFYKNNFPSAGFWLKRNAIMNPGVKSLGYFTAFYLGIPYSLFDKMKSENS